MYRVYTDSAADLPSEMFAEMDISIVPMSYEVAGSVVFFYADSEDRQRLCAEVLKAGQEGVHVRTSQIPPYAFEELWREELEAGKDVLYISVSSAMSGNYANACLTAEELLEEYPDRIIEVVDSLSATAGEGLLVLAAARKRQEGLGILENAAWLREHVLQICNLFVAGDQKQFGRGGRFPKHLAISDMLDVKHLFHVDREGRIQLSARVRGMKRAKKKLLEEYLMKREVSEEMELVFITHSADPEGGEELRKMVAKAVGDDSIVRTVCLSPIIAIHTGAQHYSICGWGKNRDMVTDAKVIL